MSVHYCISNPCWICFQHLAPKSDDSNDNLWKTYRQKVPDDSLEAKLIDLIIEDIENEDPTM